MRTPPVDLVLRRLRALGRRSPHGAYPFRCPNAGGDDDVDHVMVAELDLEPVRFPAATTRAQPVRPVPQPCSTRYHLSPEHGLADRRVLRARRRLDDASPPSTGRGSGHAVPPAAPS